MRPISLSSLALAAMFVAAPLTGAFAAAEDAGLLPNQIASQAAPSKVVLDQLSSLGDGINSALTVNAITSQQAGNLRSQIADIRSEALTLSRSAGGHIPQGEYRQLLGKIHNVSSQIYTVDHGN